MNDRLAEIERSLVPGAHIIWAAQGDVVWLIEQLKEFRKTRHCDSYPQCIECMHHNLQYEHLDPDNR